jgi:CheY-like chemotaxis protein
LVGHRRRGPILVIEDDPFSQALVRAALKADHDVVVVGTLADAWTRLQSQRPLLILLDGRLPDGTGLDFVRELRAHPTMSGIRVIATTASAMVGDRDELMTAGCDAFISKPFGAVALQALVRQNLDAVRPWRPAAGLGRVLRFRRAGRGEGSAPGEREPRLARRLLGKGVRLLRAGH